MYFHTLAQSISTIAAFLVCAYALWRGGWPEKLAGALLFVNWMATPILQHYADRTQFEVAVFILDGALTLVLLAVALFGDRFWPLWASAFQILELLMHVAMLADPRVGGRAYFIGMEVASYLILVALAIGVLHEGGRRTPSPLGSEPLRS